MHDPRLIAFCDSFVPFLSDHFADRNYFAVVYGSYAYGTQGSASDLDVCVCVESIDDADVRVCVAEVLSLHERLGLSIDCEIRHENKVLIDYAFLSRAVRGDGFRNERGWHIPIIIKSETYLNSIPLLLRFFLGAMTHKHIFLCGNRECYDRYRQQAIESLTKILLACKNTRITTVNDFIRAWIFHSETTGDYFLGFEDKPHYHSYLESLVSRSFQSLVAQGRAKNDGEGYIFDSSWICASPAVAENA